MAEVWSWDGGMGWANAIRGRGGSGHSVQSVSTGKREDGGLLRVDEPEMRAVGCLPRPLPPVRPCHADAGVGERLTPTILTAPCTHSDPHPRLVGLLLGIRPRGRNRLAPTTPPQMPEIHRTRDRQVGPVQLAGSGPGLRYDIATITASNPRSWCGRGTCTRRERCQEHSKNHQSTGSHAQITPEPEAEPALRTATGLPERTPAELTSAIASWPARSASKLLPQQLDHPQQHQSVEFLVAHTP